MSELVRIGVAMFCAFLLAPAARASAEPPTRTVLVLWAEGAAIDDPAVIQGLQDTLRNRWPSAVQFYVEDVNPSRFSDEAYRRDLPEYLREKHVGRVDLIVALSHRALDFLLENRRVFENVPMLFAGAGVSAEELRTSGMTGVIAVPEPARTVALALQLQPDTTRIVLVGGTGEADRISEQQVTRELASVSRRIPLTSLTDLSLSDLLEQVGKLEPNAIVYYTRVTRDAAGAVLVSREVLQLVRQVTRVPIYGSARMYLGAGLMGGVVIDHAAIGTALGALASRIFAGETPAAIAPVVANNVTAFDWREVRRFRVDEARLPADAIVEFREPSFWRRYSADLLYLTLIAAGGAALGITIVRQRRRRRRVQRALDERLRFEKNFADASTTFIRMGSHEIDGALRGALQRLLECVGADRALIYEPAQVFGEAWQARFNESRGIGDLSPGDHEWKAEQTPWLISRLRAGQVVTFLNGEHQHQLAASAPGPQVPAAAVVVPLTVGASMLGVLWCIWLKPPRARFNRNLVVESFLLIGQLFANAVRRSQIETKLDETRDLNAAILESLTLHVAVLDRTGTILGVNRAWMAFGRENGIQRDAAIGPGANYLEAARRAADRGDLHALEALEGVQAVCEGHRDLFTLEYECSSPSERRWFVMTVAALRRLEGGAVVTHRDITESKQVETTIRESEARFRLLADALPVGVWMSDVNARRTYFNQAWLEFTGRSLERQLGDGWTDGLHPDDRQRYLDAYRAANGAREPFSVEYRIRKDDRGYGWLADSAVPRYAIDGTFHGFIGGSVDVTERKETEHALRDLTGRVITAEEEDRRRIARDLHDGVNQLVALLAIEIEQLGLTPATSEAEIAAHTRSLWKRTAEISSELHRLSHALHPSRLETFGLVAALDGYCTEITQQHGINVIFSHEDVPTSIAPVAALCVFRIVQEALRNVVKHSGATEATVELFTRAGRLSLRVSDRGRGFDPAEKRAGLGLVSMRERVRFAGGDLTIGSRPGHGTHIDVELPLQLAEACGA